MNMIDKKPCLGLIEIIDTWEMTMCTRITGKGLNQWTK